MTDGERVFGTVKLLHRSGAGAGDEALIPPGGLVIGRGEEADLRIADRGASRLHCRISPRKEGMFLEDLQSKNGTFLNGLPVDEHPLGIGDVVQVGSHAFQVLEEEADPHATAVLFVSDEDRRETLSLPAMPAPASQNDTSGRLAAAFRMAGLLSKSTGVEDLLHQILDTLILHTGASRAAVLLYEGDPPNAKRRFTREAGGRRPDHITLGENMVKKAHRNGEALLFQNLGVDPSWPDAEGSLSLFYSAVCAPLPSPSGIRGVVYLDTLGGEGELSEKDLHLGAVAGALAGSALENAEKLKGLADRAQEDRFEPKWGMIGGSAPMKAVFELIRKTAPSGSTVLICGESGTGKELVARAIHSNSPRRNGPFVAVNCGAIPMGLLESELFGYEKGAFTGANRRTPGRFECASRGILFLDEISELPLESQVKILRTLEERTVARLGGSKNTPVDVHLIAATNQDLDSAVAQGRFRKDLYYRLRVIVIDLPPLRHRTGDIPLLVDHFLERFRTELGHRVERVEEEAMKILCAYPWPGNVRELRNTVERALVLADGDVLGSADISFLASVGAGEAIADEFPTLRAAEAHHIRKALDHCGWNKTKAAKLLGIERSTLYEKLKAHSIKK
ncbi:MAG: sigma 54-interacting transcriptional regulator [Planctomycetota bacterium]|jgi:Nif-specific regulatory protein